MATLALYDFLNLGLGFAREAPGVSVLVHKVGGDWGYSVWRGGSCVAGHRRPDWTAEAAQDAADWAVAALRVMDGPGVASR